MSQTDWRNLTGAVTVQQVLLVKTIANVGCAKYYEMDSDGV